MTKFFLAVFMMATVIVGTAMACDCAKKAPSCGCEQGADCHCP